ncbi:DNA cytosine methyltransferase (plasmid) [Pontibacillus sp. ALD_SL1]|nr:DNA cytosine methyltransferase [Pontibacillus sp. ALD_SL1]
MIKKRRAKHSKRGHYIQDIELKETAFSPGDKYKYVLDLNEKRIVILPSEDGKGNTVSKRKVKDGYKPVLDIRSKEAKAFFGEADQLQVSIYEDQVIIEVFEEEEETLLQKATRTVKNVLKKTGKVVSLSERVALKHRGTLTLSKEDLRKAAGFEQVSFEDLGWSVETDSQQGSVSDIQHALSNIGIPLQAASLFSGMGIMDKGFVDAGFDIEFAIDLSENACETYRANIGDHIVCGDITAFDKEKIPKVPLMFGGSPCQGFSAANRINGYLNNPNNPNNLLVKHFVDSVKANEACQVFVLENVPQILTAGGGRFKEEIYEALHEFDITSGVLLAADYGSPQLRERAFLIGSKIGRIDLPEPTHSPSEYTTVREAFKGLHDGIPNMKDHSDPKAPTIERMRHVPQGGNWRDIPHHLRTKKMTDSGSTQHSVYRRLEWDKPCKTIVNPRKSNITHPDLHRSLSIRECARLFDLPDTFVFKGKKNANQQGIANGVPAKLAKAVALKVKYAIEQFNIRQQHATV